MANASEEFVNSTQDFLDCSVENNFGFIFCYSLMSLCFLLGTPAHLWCVWFYFRTEQKIKETRVLLLNYTIMELIYCMESGMETLNKFVFQKHFLENVIAFFFGLCLSGRPLIQTCICIEQYLAVLHPVTFLRYKSIKYRIAAVGAVWLMAFAYGIIEVCVEYLEFDSEFIFSYLFIIALFVISFCCVSVLRALKQPGPGDMRTTNQTGRDIGNQQKRNAYNTIFTALLLILFTYAPHTLFIILTVAKLDSKLYECNISVFLTSLNDFGVIITPLLKMYREG